MNTDNFLGRMSDDSPRGFGVRSDVRKRQAEAPTLEHVIQDHHWGYSRGGEWMCVCGDLIDEPQSWHIASAIRAHVAAGGVL